MRDRRRREIGRGGESLHRQEGPNLTAEDVIKFCGTQLTAYKVPKQIEFRTDLPKTNVGKILRRELRDEKKAAACAHGRLSMAEAPVTPAGIFGLLATPALTAGTRPTTRSTRRCAGAFSACGRRRQPANYRHGNER